MTIIAFLSVLVCIVGLIMYLVSSVNPKVAEIGKIMFACGLLVALFMFGSSGVSLNLK